MRKYFSILIISLFCLSFNFANNTLELKGSITSDQGFIIPKTYVQIWEKGEIIAQTKTDNFGKYKLTLPKIGTFTLKAGYKNKFFHPQTIQDYTFTTIAKFEYDFVLKIDKQVLHEECSRLRESYRHMIHNPKNLTYRRSFLNRFPKCGIEMELFFSNEVLELNLKKEAKRYLHTVFEKNFTGRTTYVMIFLKFAQKTDMRATGKNTKIFYEEAVKIIHKNKEIVFKELESVGDKYVSNFFIWMFSGGSFGTKKMDQSFDYLSPKYPKTYILMQQAHQEYLNKKQ